MASEKENILERNMEGPSTPNRLPLQEVGNSLSRSGTPVLLKRAQYSQVTPFTTPTKRTPVRQKRTGMFADIHNIPQDIPLNFLIYKKVAGMLAEKQQELDDLVEQKDATIERLQRQLQTMTLSLVASAGDPDESAQPISSVPATVDCGCSPHPTPVPFHTSFQHNAEQMDSLLASPNLPGTQDHHEKAQNSTGFLPQLDSVSALELVECDPEVVGECSRDDDDDNDREAVKDLRPSQEKFTSNRVNTTPKVFQSLGTCRTPVTSQTLATCMTPVTSQTLGTCMTPVIVSNTGTVVTPVRFSSAAVNTCVVETHSEQTNTTPIRRCDQQTGTTPCQTRDFSENTSLERLVEIDCKGTQTVASETSQISIGTETAGLLSTQSSSSQTGPAGTSTDSFTMVTPTKSSSICINTSPDKSEQLKSPHQVDVVDKGVCTSPFSHALPRPSEIDFSSLSITDLALQLETASISNTLLRSEMEQLKHDKMVVQLQALLTEDERKQLKAEAERREKLAKLTISSQVEDLMEQQSQLLSQISALEQELDKKDNVLQEAEKAHAHQVAGLQEELSNLRHDLVTAYQLRKQEVKSLRAEYTATDYRPLYEKMRKEVELLKTQVDVFMGLEEQLEETQRLQNEAAELVSARSQEVVEQLAAVQTQQEEHRKWQQEHEEWTIKKSDLENEMADSEKKCSQLQERLTDIEQQLSSSTDRITQLIGELEAARDQDKIRSGEIEKLEAALKVNENEATSAKASMDAAQGEIAHLNRTVSELRTAVCTQTERASLLVRERDRYAQLNDQQRQSLQRLRATAQRADWLQEQFNTLQTEHNAELEIYQKRANDLYTDIEFLTAECNVQKTEFAQCQQRVQDLQEQNTQLTDELTLLRDELASTQAHHQIILRHKDSESTAAGAACEQVASVVEQLRSHLAGHCVVQHTEENLTHEMDSDKKCIVPPTSGNHPPRSRERRSLIASVLKAVSGEESPVPEVTNTSPDKTSSTVAVSSCPPQPTPVTTNEIIDSSLPLNKQLDEMKCSLEGMLPMLQQLQRRIKDMSVENQKVTELETLVESHQKTIDRYSNQKKKLNYNWKTAETELKKLEQIIETVREVLCDHQHEIRARWPESGRLDRLGMLHSDDSGPQDVTTALLRSKQTC